MKEQVALFGGSFNPPHIGHTLAITYALSQHVDRVLVVPTFKHALGKELIAFEHRVEMAKLALEFLNKGTMFLKVNVLSIEREIGHSRTLDTIKALYKRFASPIQLRLLVGADILKEKDKWHRFDEIERLAPPIVLNRGGWEPTNQAVTLPAVSSSRIRHIIARKNRPDILEDKQVLSLIETELEETVHPDVRKYIKKHKLYEVNE